jgi:hypothetical protein
MTGLAAFDMDSHLASRLLKISLQFLIHEEARLTFAHDTPEATISPAIRRFA